MKIAFTVGVVDLASSVTCGGELSSARKFTLSLDDDVNCFSFLFKFLLLYSFGVINGLFYINILKLNRV